MTNINAHLMSESVSVECDDVFSLCCAWSFVARSVRRRYLRSSAVAVKRSEADLGVT